MPDHGTRALQLDYLLVFPNLSARHAGLEILRPRVRRLQSLLTRRLGQTLTLPRNASPRDDGSAQVRP